MRHIGALLVGRAWLIALGTLIGVGAARVLSVDDLAVYFVATGVAGVAAAFGEFGAVLDATRRIAGDPGTFGGVVRSSARAVARTTSIACLVGVVGWLIVDRLDRSLPMDVVIATGATTVALVGQRWMSGLLLGLGRPGAAQIVDGLVSRTAVAICLMVAIVVDSSIDVVWLLAASCAAVAAGLLLGAHLLIASRPSTHSIDARATVTFGSSWRIGVVKSFSVLQTLGAVAVVGWFGVSEQTAEFGVAWRLAILVAVPQQVVNTVAQHRLRQALVDRGPHEAAEIARSYALVSTVVGGLILAAVALSAPLSVPLLFGDSYSDAAVLVAILGTGQLIGVAAGPVGNLLIAADADSAVMAGAALGAVSMLVAVASGTVWFGATGAAVGLSASIIASNGYWWWRCRDRLGRVDALSMTSLPAARAALRTSP